MILDVTKRKPPTPTIPQVLVIWHQFGWVMTLRRDAVAIGPLIRQESRRSNSFFFLYMFLANQRFISHNFLLCRTSQRSARSQVPSQVATHQKIGSQLWVGETPGRSNSGLYSTYIWQDTIRQGLENFISKCNDVTCVCLCHVVLRAITLSTENFDRALKLRCDNGSYVLIAITFRSNNFSPLW
jgi:hypothetical protein